MSTFPGFPTATFRYLKQLQKNNDRDWFADNKRRYEDDWLRPSLEFIQAMQVPMNRISECFAVTPKRVGGSLMRIYKDTRFSKDKTPYKTNIGIQFRHIAGKDVHAPGFYVHIEPGNCFLGAGVWRSQTSVAREIREHIVEEPEQWLKSIRTKKFRDRFQLTGESLKRPPAGFDRGHELMEHLKRKDFIAIAELDDAFFGSPTLTNQVVDHFKATVPLMKFLCSAVGQPF